VAIGDGGRGLVFQSRLDDAFRSNQAAGDGLAGFGVKGPVGLAVLGNQAIPACGGSDGGGGADADDFLDGDDAGSDVLDAKRKGETDVSHTAIIAGGTRPTGGQRGQAASSVQVEGLREESRREEPDATGRKRGLAPGGYSTQVQDFKDTAGQLDYSVATLGEIEHGKPAAVPADLIAGFQVEAVASAAGTSGGVGGHAIDATGRPGRTQAHKASKAIA